MSAGGFFDDLLRDAGSPRPAATPKAERGVPVRGRQIDGEFYVRADDVVALLEVNSLLPQTVKKLRSAIQRGRS